MISIKITVTGKC